MMKYGGRSEILWYNLPNSDSWELVVLDAVYGRESFWDQNTTNFTVEINPSTPIIAMPQDWFAKVAELYMQDKSDSEAFCTSIMCIHYGSCAKSKGSDFKFRIGGGENSTSQPKYFSVPASAYLIEAHDLGIPGNFCILGLTGFVPYGVNKMYFGSVFL